MRPDLLAERRMQRASQRAAVAWQSYNRSLTDLIKRAADYHDKVMETLNLGRHNQIPVELPQEAVRARGVVARKRRHFERAVAELKTATKEYHQFAQREVDAAGDPPQPKRRRVAVKAAYRGRGNQPKLRIVRVAQWDILNGVKPAEAAAQCKQRIAQWKKEQRYEH